MVNRRRVRVQILLGCALLGLAGLSTAALSREKLAAANNWVAEGQAGVFGRAYVYRNTAGAVGVISAGGEIDTATHPFFAAIGTNGRACVTCHQPADAMSISVPTIRSRWKTAGPSDPLFAGVDGKNCPSLPQEKRASHSLLLDHGLFRIGLAWPPRNPDGSAMTPEFEIEVLKDPSTCNLDPVYGIRSPKPTVSVFRRPRPPANLRYATTPYRKFNTKIGMPQPVNPETGQRTMLPILADGRQPTLKMQAAEAIRVHLQGGQATPAQLAAIEAFESQIYVAQEGHPATGLFVETGGPKALGVAAMETGRAMVFANNWKDPVFHDFEAWKTPRAADPKAANTFRASVARGYEIFMERPLWISDTAHFNSIGMGNPYKRNCAVCHNSQMVGTDITPGMIDIGVNNKPWALENPDLPLFKLTCRKDAAPHPYLGREIVTHDPGRALITGKCADIGSLVMQQMRGLASRAPYFSNGSAKDLNALVDFYNKRFDMKLSDQEHADLVNFLSVL